MNSPLELLGLIGVLTALGFWMEKRFDWAAKVGSTMLVILFGFTVSNLKLVPFESPAYGAIAGPVTDLAIVWLLFAVNLRDLKKAGKSMLILFAVAVFATGIGALICSLLFARTVGPETWKLGGVLLGAYSGGSLNFAGVAKGLLQQGQEVPKEILSATMAADNVMTAVWFGVTLMVPRWFSRRADRAEPMTEAAPNPLAGVSFEVRDVALLMAGGFVVILASEWVSQKVAGVPGIIWLTTIALGIGQLPFVRRLKGALPMGILALHFFFVVIGIGSRIDKIAVVGWSVFFMVAGVVAVHGVLLYGFAAWRKNDLDEASVASQAAIGGPSTALALAVARNRREYVLPGVAVGLLGYAVGTYAGLGLAFVLKRMLG
jgi:uncharacterized membrane protein